MNEFVADAKLSSIMKQSIINCFLVLRVKKASELSEIRFASDILINFILLLFVVKDGSTSSLRYVLQSESTKI